MRACVRACVHVCVCGGGGGGGGGGSRFLGCGLKRQVLWVGLVSRFGLAVRR